jgi:hypothetical protein
MGTGGRFPGGKARPGRDADHSPPCSAEVKNESELYLLSPHVPTRHVVGQLYFLIRFEDWIYLPFSAKGVPTLWGPEGAASLH